MFKMFKMFKKNLYVFSAIATGLVWLFLLLLNSRYVFTHDKLDMWIQLLFWPSLIGCGSFTVLGIAKITKCHLFFRIVSLLILFSAASLLPIPSHNPVYGWEGVPIIFYISDEENVISYIFYAYLFLIGIIGVAACVKQKWLPGVGLLAISLPTLVPIIANWLSIDIQFYTNIWSSDWFFIQVIFITFAWFVIAWWLYKENSTAPNSMTLDPV